MNDFSILATEPLKDWEPDDVRRYLAEHDDHQHLATAMCMVWNKTGWLCHDLDDDPPTVTREQFDKWWILEKELLSHIATVLKLETSEQATPESMGWCKYITPFMERNGFRNANGWWRQVET